VEKAPHHHPTGEYRRIDHHRRLIISRPLFQN
jgi:hypothetical protein